MLSDYCKEIADKYGIKVGNVKKFISNLGNKTNYVLHYKNLQLYLQIFRVLKFKQSDWMKSILNLTLKKKKKMLLIVLKNIFLN